MLCFFVNCFAIFNRAKWEHFRTKILRSISYINCTARLGIENQWIRAAAAFCYFSELSVCFLRVQCLRRHFRSTIHHPLLLSFSSCHIFPGTILLNPLVMKCQTKLPTITVTPRPLGLQLNSKAPTIKLDNSAKIGEKENQNNTNLKFFNLIEEEEVTIYLNWLGKRGKQCNKQSTYKVCPCSVQLGHSVRHNHFHRTGERGQYMNGISFCSLSHRSWCIESRPPSQSNYHQLWKRRQ